MTELTRISSKGQVVIPIKIRDQLNINKGAIMAIDTTKDLIILKRVDVDLVNQFKNSLSDLKAGKIKRIV
jgi:AbrB family looped-hinge helix DNA binding protein